MILSCRSPAPLLAPIGYQHVEWAGDHRKFVDRIRESGRAAKAVIVVTLLALVLLTAVPVALLAAVVMMILGHVVGGLALFGGSVLAAAMAVALAGMTGMQHLRRLLSRASFNVVQLDRRQYTDDIAEPNGNDYTDVVQLDRSEYTEVR